MAAPDEEDGDADNASTLADDEEGAEELLQAHTAAQSEAFDAEMKERLKSKGDRFEEMVEHEEGIRLGDEGWKERYYKVQPCQGILLKCPPSSACALLSDGSCGEKDMWKAECTQRDTHTSPSSRQVVAEESSNCCLDRS